MRQFDQVTTTFRMGWCTVRRALWAIFNWLNAARVQNLILTLTLGAAIWIGFKQNEINERLLNLNYFPEVKITYDTGRKVVDVVNRGKSGLLLLGDKLDGQQKVIGSRPEWIAPGGFYYIHADAMEQEVRQKLGPNSGDHEASFDIYIQTENLKKHTVKGLFIFITVNGSVLVDSQTLSVAESDWSR
jgi:hypothetical protein